MGGAWRWMVLVLVPLLVVEHSTGIRHDNTRPVTGPRGRPTRVKGDDVDYPTVGPPDDVNYPTVGPPDGGGDYPTITPPKQGGKFPVTQRPRPCLPSPSRGRAVRQASRPYIVGGVNDTHKEVILDKHNSLRQWVARGKERMGVPGPQPPAANMRRMVWNEELAFVAQRRADRCSIQSDACYSGSHLDAGQNWVALGSNITDTAPNWIEAIDEYYKNVTHFDPAFISPFQAWEDISTYTQTVWADSYRVGCGYTMYEESAGSDVTWKMYVCNYDPAGNVIGGNMYLEGEACSRCPEGTACSTKYKGLCE